MTTKCKIRAIIVDDEELARQILCEYLAAHADIAARAPSPSTSPLLIARPSSVHVFPSSVFVAPDPATFEAAAPKPAPSLRE